MHFDQDQEECQQPQNYQMRRPGRGRNVRGRSGGRLGISRRKVLRLARHKNQNQNQINFYKNKNENIIENCTRSNCNKLKEMMLELSNENAILTHSRIK